MQEWHLNERYRLLSELGQGGMGTVYSARDTLLDRDVAVRDLDQAARLLSQR